MRLLSKTSCILRQSTSTCGISVAERLSQIKCNTIYTYFLNTFPSRHGDFKTPRFFTWDFATRKVQLKQYTVITADGDGEFSDVEYTFEKIRLYPDHECELINQVLGASSFEEILNASNVVSSMNLRLASQIVVTINELLRSAYPVRDEELSTILLSVQSSLVYQKCLEILEKEFDDIPDFAVLDVFLSLRRFISDEHVLFTKCLLKCQELIPHSRLKELSKFSIAMLKSGKRYLPLLAPVVDKMSTFIEDCKTDEDIRNVAICLGSGTCIKFASSECVNRFAKQVEVFILSGKELEVITAINCLTVFIHSDSDVNLIQLQQLLISFIISFVPKLNTIQIRLLFQSISYAKCNTDLIMTAIEQRLSVLLQESKNVRETILLLYCVNQHASNLKHKYLVYDCVKKHPEFYDLKEAYHISLLMGTMYNIFPLQNTKLSLHLLKLCCSENLPIKSIKRIVRDLMYFRIIFGSVMTGENVKEFTDFCLSLAENSVKCQDVALFSSFIITDLGPKVAVTFIQRLKSILPQLNIKSLALVSLSLSIASGNSNSMSQVHQKELEDLSSKVLKIFANLIPSCENLTEYNNILKSLSGILSHMMPKNQAKEAMIHNSFFNGYNKFLENFNFDNNNIISTCKTIKVHRICLPRVLDTVAQCIVEQPATQSVRAVTQALNACYTVNYNPQSQQFLMKCQDIIMSANQLFSCQGLLQSAMCLGLNNALTDQIIHLIFNQGFLERLEKEIFVCSIFQARGIRMALARLNKIVCLDCPEENVPWFHEQYYKALVLNDDLSLNAFEVEVYKVLCQILPRQEFIETKVYTPYYYLISFLLHLDKSGNCPVENTDPGLNFRETSRLGIQRVAVDVLPESQYCRNMPRLTGYAALKKRHLEILGYKLIQVPFFEWNSLQLSNKESKVDYLCTRIFQST